MNSIFAIILFELTILISALLQVPLKKAALNPKYTGLKTYLNPLVLTVYFCFFLITFATTYLYQYVDLAFSTLLYKTEYIFVTLIGVLILKEKLSVKKIIGIALIIAGVVIYSVF